MIQTNIQEETMAKILRNAHCNILCFFDPINSIMYRIRNSIKGDKND
jgi:hypothetical protein